MIFKKIIYLLFILIILYLPSNAQEGSTINHENISIKDVPARIQQARNTDHRAVAFCFPYNYSLVPENNKFLTSPRELLIELKGASGISFHFSEFYLPGGSRLVLSDPSGKQEDVNYYAAHNPHSGLFATEFIFSDRVLISYIPPDSAEDNAVLEIAQLAWYFEEPAKLHGNASNKSTSTYDSCHVGVYCSPEGDNWQDEKRGVVRMALKNNNTILLTTGTLMNNTAQDCTPYILTAENCALGMSASELNQSIFYFNFEDTICGSNGVITGYGTLTGASRVSNGGIGCSTGSDFYLMKLNQAIPPSFNAYFNGWDRSGNPSPGGVSIHHGVSNNKLISTYNTSTISSQFGSGVFQTHWRVKWTATPNGHGKMEFYSNGAVLFDTAKHVIGTYSGGVSSCNDSLVSDFFGKFNTSWDQNGTTTQLQLKNWLDPLNTGAIKLDGMYCTSFPPESGLLASSNFIVTGDSILYSDNSLYGATAWQWSFPGGTPSVYNQQHPPAVVYDSIGLFNVMLVTSNAYGTDTLLMQDYIHVLPVSDTITTRIDTAYSCEGEVIITVRIENAYQVKNSSLTITYNNLLSLQGYRNPNAAINNGNLQVYETSGETWVVWNAAGPVDLGNSVLIELIFQASPGISSLGWNTGRPWKCQYYNNNGTKYPVKFTGSKAYIDDCARISGSLNYINSLIDPIYPAGISFSGIDSAAAVTDTSGNFISNYLHPGIYTIDVQPTKSWNGANATDALLVVRHFVSLHTLYGLYHNAGDVDNSGDLNANDALHIIRRFVNLQDSFPAGDWIIDKQGISIGTNDTGFQAEGLCYGDVDGSYVTSVKSGDEFISREGVMNTGSNITSLAITFSQSINISAFSIDISLTGLPNIIDISTLNDKGELKYNIIGNRLLLAWYSIYPEAFNKDDTALVIYLKTSFSPEEYAASGIHASGELAGEYGNIIKGPLLKVPAVITGKKDDMITIFPNPAQHRVNILTGIEPDNGFDVILYSGNGKLLMSQTYNITAGQLIEVDLTDYPSGIYFISINYSENGRYMMINKKFIRE